MPHTGKDTANLDMIGRMVMAAGRRLADYDPEELPRLLRIKGLVDEAMVEAIAGMRLSGVTWQSIGDSLGVTRQAVIMGYGPAVADAHRRAIREVQHR